jgi:hypothetical protein
MIKKLLLLDCFEIQKQNEDFFKKKISELEFLKINSSKKGVQKITSTNSSVDDISKSSYVDNFKLAPLM